MDVKQQVIPTLKYKDWLINQKQPLREDKNYVPFWLKHIEYCKSGVLVGGVYISGWLYWHLNFFKVTIDKEDEYGNIIPEITNLTFRDNEFYMDYGFNSASKTERRNPLITFGTRRFAKSVVLASRITHKSFIFQNSHSVIIGGSAADINNITKYISDFLSSKPDCFSDLTKVGDFSKASTDVEIVYSEKEAKARANSSGQRLNPITLEFFKNVNTSEKRIVFSRIAVRNLEHGQVSTKGEILAGITPTEVIFDECGKFMYNNQWLALKPALSTSFGKYRTTVLFMGTGGDVDYSQDAEEHFLNSLENNFTVCNPDSFREIVNYKYFPLEQKNTNTGLFVPGQMSLEGGEKEKVLFKDYIKRKWTDEELEEIDGMHIYVTRWKESTEHLEKLIEKEKDDLAKIKQRMYYPFQPEDCFLVKGKNPFPVEASKRTRLRLEEEGLIGEYFTLSKTVTGEISLNYTDKTPINQYPFKGGSYDAPVVILERPLSPNKNEIKYGTYIAGFDGYKLSQSETTDSVGAMYIFKRVAGLKGYRNQIVAYIATRPQDDRTFYRQCLYLLELYNAILLPESDTNLYNYLKEARALHYLADCKNVVEYITPNSKANISYGLPSNTTTKKHYLKLVRSYCWEEIEIGQDEHGLPIMDYGVTRIHDPLLLLELENYREGGNFDRIAAFGHALVWDEHLNIKGVKPDDKPYTPDDELRSILRKGRKVIKDRKTTGKYRRSSRWF